MDLQENINRIKQVMGLISESTEEVTNIANEFMSSNEYDKNDDCKMSTKRFVKWLKDNKKITPNVILLSPPKDIKKFPGKSLKGDSHIFTMLGGYGIDFTANQFPDIIDPLKITLGSDIAKEYEKIGGYFTTSPDYFGYQPYIIDKFENLPQWFHDGFKKGIKSEK